MDIVEQVARAMYEKTWPGGCSWEWTGEKMKLGYRSSAGTVIGMVHAADSAARRVTVDADDLAETVERVLCLAEQEDDAGAFYVAKMIRDPARRLQAAVDALEDE